MATVSRLTSTIIAACLLYEGNRSCASIPPDAENATLTAIVNWVLETGKDSIIRKNISAAIGLPPTDVRVRERGFRGPGDSHTHVCAVLVENVGDHVICFALVDEATGDGLVWRVSPDGTILYTLRLLDGTVERVSNEQLRSAFEMEKVYFMKIRRERSGRGAQ